MLGDDDGVMTGELVDVLGPEPVLLNDEILDLGMACLTSTILPLMMCSLTTHTASEASSVSNVTNPKPRALCVSLLNITSAATSLPNCSK